MIEDDLSDDVQTWIEKHHLRILGRLNQSAAVAKKHWLIEACLLSSRV